MGAKHWSRRERHFASIREAPKAAPLGPSSGLLACFSAKQKKRFRASREHERPTRDCLALMLVPPSL
jgi:hypothetical protein